MLVYVGMQMRARARQPGWGPYAGQQLLQNPAPSSDQPGQPYPIPVGIGVCHACSGVGLQTVSSRPTTAATESAAVAGTEAAGPTGLQASIPPAPLAALAGQPRTPREFGSMHSSVAASGGGSVAGRSAHLPVLAPADARMLRAGSVGDLRVMYGSTAGGALQPMPLLHLGSAPEGAMAAAAAAPSPAAGSNSSSATGGYHYFNPAFHPSHMPSEQARQHWQKQLLHQHLWQQQQVLQEQQRAQRRRHSVCVGSVHRRMWTKPYGVRAEMCPFEEAEEWSFQLPHTATSPPVQQQGVTFSPAGATVGSTAAATTPGSGVDSVESADAAESRESSHVGEPLASIDGCVPAMSMRGAASYPNLTVLPGAGMSNEGSAVDSEGVIVSCPAMAQGTAAEVDAGRGIGFIG